MGRHGTNDSKDQKAKDVKNKAKNNLPKTNRSLFRIELINRNFNNF